jgi:hypothetical protein
MLANSIRPALNLGASTFLVDADYERLIGDAARSPLTETRAIHRRVNLIHHF